VTNTKYLAVSSSETQTVWVEVFNFSCITIDPYLLVQPSAFKTVLPSAFLHICHFNILRILIRNFLCKQYYQVMWSSVEHWLKWCGTVHVSTELIF